MSIVLKSGSLNLLEPSGPVQASNGIALPLPEDVTSHLIVYSDGTSVVHPTTVSFVCSFAL